MFITIPTIVILGARDKGHRVHDLGRNLALAGRQQRLLVVLCRALQVPLGPQGVAQGQRQLVGSREHTQAAPSTSPLAEAGPSRAGCTIGSRTVLTANTFIGRETMVGEQCLFHPNVTVRERVTIGDRALKDGNVEYRYRSDAQTQTLPLDEIYGKLAVAQG